MNIFVGIDDKDNPGSRGTGRLARGIASELCKTYGLYGVTRHQLLVHPDIPYTSHNSAAVIHLDSCGAADVSRIFSRVKKLMLAVSSGAFRHWLKLLWRFAPLIALIVVFDSLFSHVSWGRSCSRRSSGFFA